MTEKELSAMTVMQLRKLAKDRRITLGAGIDKAGIVRKILENESAFPVRLDAPVDENIGAVQSEPVAPPVRDSAAAQSRVPVRESSVPDRAAGQAAAPAQESAGDQGGNPRFQAAWHNSDAPHFNVRPAYQAPGAAPRPAWQNTTPSGHQLPQQSRVQPTRPGSFTPRFGPAAAAPAPAPAEPAPERREPAAPSVNPLPERRFNDAPSYTHRISANYTPAYTASRPQETFTPPQAQDAGGAPTLEELLESGNYEEGSGILELHPDGYGFLRAPSFLPSTRDIYVSMAQIRRFGLRTGDLIEGKVRPQREGDKYAALLYISTVNGVPEENAFTRPAFDELTPVYPDRRISLETPGDASLPDMRLIDLIAPIGFGQRGLILCPPNTGKTQLMRNIARVISRNYPESQVLMLLIDVNPEDATLMRESVPCQVLSSSFDQAPESHLRLSEIVLERAMRLVEQKKDVVLLVDSLTRLAKVYTSAAVQQGRSLPGMVNPASLFRAKRMFGAARSCKEGGSLTVIAAMDIATGSKVDDSVVEEFKGTANMELTLDLSVARAGVSPALNLQHSYTKNADILLNDQQKEGLTLIRTMLGTTSSAVAIPQLISMMEKTETNEQLLIKMKDWFALMNR